MEIGSSQITADEIIRRWDELAERLWLTGMDLSVECRQLGQRAAYIDSEIDRVYANYVQLLKTIDAQVDAINEEIKRLQGIHVVDYGEGDNEYYNYD